MKTYKVGVQVILYVPYIIKAVDENDAQEAALRMLEDESLNDLEQLTTVVDATEIPDRPDATCDAVVDYIEEDEDE